MKIMLDEGGIMPTRAHENDAGLDMYSRNDALIGVGKSAVFDTGVHFELPKGTFGKLESKSGLHVNCDIVCLGGVIDEGYRGSVKVKLYNFGNKPYMVFAGDKIVQMIIQPYVAPQMEVADMLDETERGTSGFGSTGR